MTAFRGIRLRITAFATLTVAVVMLIAGLVLMIVQQRVLTNNLDEILQSNSESIELALSEGSTRPVLPQQGSEDAIAQVIGLDCVMDIPTAISLHSTPTTPPCRPSSTSRPRCTTMTTAFSSTRC